MFNLLIRFHMFSNILWFNLRLLLNLSLFNLPLVSIHLLSMFPLCLLPLNVKSLKENQELSTFLTRKPSLNTKLSKELNTFPRKRRSLIITQLNTKLNTFLKFTKTDTSTTFPLKESKNVLNIKLLKSKLSINQFKKFNNNKFMFHKCQLFKLWHNHRYTLFLLLLPQLLLINQFNTKALFTHNLNKLLVDQSTNLW